MAVKKSEGLNADLISPFRKSKIKNKEKNMIKSRKNEREIFSFI